jgi:hypothetical protein
VQGDPARPRALPQGIVMGSGSSQREAEGGCQQRSPHAGASARGRGRRASRCGRPPGFASHRSPRLLAPRSGPRQDRSASTGVRTVASDLLADQSVDAKGLLLGIHARNADVGEDERPSVAMTGSISSCGGPTKNKRGFRGGGPGRGPESPGRRGQDEAAGKGSAEVVTRRRVEQSRGRGQAGASLEPRTALTRGRAGAGRWPGQGEAAWRGAASARGWPGPSRNGGRLPRRGGCPRSEGRRGRRSGRSA